MLNKRGYSYGAEYPYHFEQRDDGWAVFHAGTDKDEATGLTEWEAGELALKLNGLGWPSQETLDEIDGTP